MRESTMYQSILQEGEEIGLERGRAEGLQQERALVLKLLARIRRYAYPTTTISANQSQHRASGVTRRSFARL
jgi:predicted transposase YdaD